MTLNLLSDELATNTQSLIKILLGNRGVSDADKFLHPDSPLKLSLADVNIDSRQMRKAVRRLMVAKEKGEKIIIFGDYDCDGVCATAVIWETLYENGFKVLPFIPSREKHGYGLSIKAVDEILSQGTPAILISVDNGIVAHPAWKKLGEAGVFRILTDHHEPDTNKPEVEAIIHTTALCGTTVSWMLAREIDKQKAGDLLDLCALATIADQVPLVGVNRRFAKHGLTQLNSTKRLGLQLLIEAGGLKATEINSFAVNFGIVPRINAMGRLGHAMDALRALCTTDKQRAIGLVEKLTNTNVDRQDLTKELVELALSRAKEWENERIIVVADAAFHEGVIGLIAGKLMEEFHKPAIVISIGEITSKASARSIPGIHITKLLREVSGHLLEVGGHPLAAGFRIETTKIVQFKLVLGEKANKLITDEQLQATLQLDCELPSQLVTLETAQELKMLEPFGQANPEPSFFIKSVRLEHMRQVGKEGRHLSTKVNLGSQTISAIAFNQGVFLGQIDSETVLSLAATLDVNSWKDRVSVQLRIKKIISSSLPQ